MIRMYKIMIVEDDKNMCFLYSKMKDWSECGFRISKIAYNGKEALKQLRKKINMMLCLLIFECRI
mgnify:CR=1 FL=1